jgi:hypothetical protein
VDKYDRIAFSFLCKSTRSCDDPICYDKRFAMAQLLRESAAEAYSEMAARMWELNRLASPADHIQLTESRATEMSIYAGESAYLRSRAASLRPSPSTETEEK